MNISRLQALKILLKLLLIVGLVITLYYSALEEAFEDYFFKQGIKLVSRSVTVDSHKPPAFTYCFQPSFNSTSKVTRDCFLGECEMHKDVPRWDLFYDSAFKLGRDLDITFSYEDNRAKLKEGVTTFENGYKVETYSLPTWGEGLCYSIIPSKMLVMKEIEIFIDFYDSVEVKPKIANLYITAPNDWPMLTFPPRSNKR